MLGMAFENLERGFMERQGSALSAFVRVIERQGVKLGHVEILRPKLKGSR